MNDFNDLLPKDLYHSYIIESDEADTVFHLRKFLEERGDIDTNSSDILCQNYDSFTISDSPVIKEWHSESRISDKKRVCIIGVKFINHDAERTLLKILEEPASNTHFFIVIPNALMLLDTIRSRAHIVKIKSQENDLIKKNAKDFILMQPKDRIDFIAKMIKDNENNDDSGVLRYSAIIFINNLEQFFYQKFKENKNDKKIQFILEELKNSRDFLSLPGCSPKMILEHISLVI